VYYIHSLHFPYSESHKDGMRMIGQNNLELQQTIFDRFEITEEDGEFSNHVYV
jgi:hypothetical protein